ncbi:hypothetical protein DTW91_09305 [Chryseobacterium sp. SC28]|nr:hypothetical protein DTW91_09305 [Chryseobacterium sp. SC28]
MFSDNERSNLLNILHVHKKKAFIFIVTFISLYEPKKRLALKDFLIRNYNIFVLFSKLSSHFHCIFFLFTRNCIKNSYANFRLLNSKKRSNFRNKKKRVPRFFTLFPEKARTSLVVKNENFVRTKTHLAMKILEFKNGI